jgi:4-amino-4-deoxy-L-arabinose transferase-like glycosyltransferase
MRLAPLLLVLSCAAVLFTGLDRIGFTDWREARDARVARELIARREVLTPLLGQDPLFEKPVLAYAPEAAAALLSPGEPGSPLRSRLWRAAIAVALALLTFSIGAEHFGARAGWTAATVLVTSFALPHAARTDGTQLLGTLLGWVGAAGFADALFGRARGRDLRLVVAWGALAAAFVVAGPLPALWPLGALALYTGLARHPGGTRAARPLAGLVLVAGAALPWYGAMIERHGLAFAVRAPFFPYAAETPGPWLMGGLMALSFLVVGMFPWTTLAPEALRHAAAGWRRGHRPLAAGAAPLPGDPLARERREESAAHYFVACLIVACVPMALYPGPPLTAMLPALPAAALLCGRLLDHLDEAPQRLAGAVRRATAMLALAGTVAGVLFVVLATRVLEAAPPLRLLGAAVFATSWLPFLASFMGRHRLAAALLALPVAVGAPLASTTLLPAIEDVLNTRAVAEALDIAAPATAPLVLDEPPRPSLRLYARHDLVVVPGLDGPLDAWRAPDSLVYAAFRPARERSVMRAAGAAIEIVLRTPTLVLARIPSAR